MCSRIFTYLGCIALSLMISGCAVVSVAGAAVSVAGAVVSVGAAAGSAAVGVVSTVAKGVVGAGGVVVDSVTE